MMAAGADVVVRASWQGARWLDKDGAQLDLVLALVRNTSGIIDQPVWLGRKGAEPLALRLVAVKMPPTLIGGTRRSGRCGRPARRRSPMDAKSSRAH